MQSTVLVMLMISGCAGAATSVDAGAANEDSAAPLDLSVPDLSIVNGCLPQMIRINGFCVDQYEAYVVELTDGGERAHSPFDTVDNLTVAARVAYGVHPQGY